MLGGAPGSATKGYCCVKPLLYNRIKIRHVSSKYIIFWTHTSTHKSKKENARSKLPSSKITVHIFTIICRVLKIQNVFFISPRVRYHSSCNKLQSVELDPYCSCTHYMWRSWHRLLTLAHLVDLISDVPPPKHQYNPTEPLEPFAAEPTRTHAAQFRPKGGSHKLVPF